MKFVATVHEPMYEFNSKKYIRFVIPIKVSEIIERMHTQRSHLLVNQNIDAPLDGRVLTVKVPFRYRRVMCDVKGRPVQSLIKGDEVGGLECRKLLWLLLDTLEFLNLLSGIIGKINSLETTLLKPLKGLEHTL